MAIATAFSTEMTQITGNTGGNIDSLPRVTSVTGRVRSFVATISLAAQAAGTVFGIARLPKGANLLEIKVATDTSLGSTTIAFGDANTTALFGAAQTLTATQTHTLIGLVSEIGTPLDGTNYDCTTGAASPASAYEDITMTTAVAALPASGTLKVLISYVID
jgi:uncharacterized membrane protein YdfJ with MMPL/SSD domain